MLPLLAGLSHRGPTLHLPGRTQRPPPRGRFEIQEDAMSTDYLMPLISTAKISLRPSQKAIKRAALALAAGARNRRRGRLWLRLSHHRPLPGIDRRRLRQGRLHDHLAESVRLHRAGAGRRQPAGQGRPVAGPDRRSRFPRRAGSGACRCRCGRSRGAQPRCADRPAAADHRTGNRRRRRRRSQPAIRAGRTGPLRRPDEDRLRHHSARAADRRGVAREDRAVAARASPAWSRRSARSTFSPPNAPRPWRSSIAPARSNIRRR